MNEFYIYFEKSTAKSVVAARISGGRVNNEDNGMSYWFYDDKDGLVAVVPREGVRAIIRKDQQA